MNFSVLAYRLRRKTGSGLLFVAVIILMTGCQTPSRSMVYRASDRLQPKAASTNASPDMSATADSMSAKAPLPERKFQKWNPIWWFGNIDNPVPPDWYRPDDPGRNWKWYGRNPFHNFMFYVIGIADKDWVRVGLYPEKIHNPNGGWNWAVSKYKFLRLPYISYKRNGFDFYLGWRNRGNFGARMKFKKAP